MVALNHQFIGRKKWDLVKKDQVVLDFSSFSFIEPIGLTFLAGLITSQKDLSKEVTVQFAEPVLNYLERIDFLQFLEAELGESVILDPARPKITRTPLRGNLLELRKTTFGDRFQMRQIISELAQVTSQKSRGAIPSVFVNDVFAELLDNVRRHSGEGFFFVIAQAYERVVKIAIADLGVGIPAKIKSEFRTVQTDPDAIIYATEPGISTYVEGGWGLTILRNYLQFTGDYLFIASNNGCVKFINSRPYQYHNFECGFSGTFVEVCFRTDVIRTPEKEGSFLPF